MKLVQLWIECFNRSLAIKNQTKISPLVLHLMR